MKTLLRIFIVLLIFVTAIVSFLLTPSGLTIAMKIATPFIPGKLTYQKISGVVIGPIVIHDLHYENKTETIDAKKLTINWHPVNLFKRDIQISALTATDATVKINGQLLPNKMDEQAIQHWIASIVATLKKSDSFFQVTIQHAHITNLQINDSLNQLPITIKQVVLHSIMTPTTWDTQVDATISKPHPFSLQFHLTGKPTNYQVKMLINGYQTHWSLIGNGNQNAIQVTTENTQLLNGLLKAQWDLTWGNHLTWHGSIKADRINTALIDPQWETPISIDLQSDGSNDTQLQTNTQASIQIPNASLHLNIVRNKQWHVHWNLTTDSISQWMPNASGAFTSQGDVNGDLQNPTVTIAVNGHYTNQAVNVTDARVKLSGTLLSHTLSAHITLPTEKIQLHLSGTLKNKQWFGNLQQLSLEIGDNNTWQLTTTSQLTGSLTAFSFSPICLKQNGTGTACVEGHTLKNILTAQTHIQLQNLNWLARLFPTLKIPSGGLTANLQINGPLQKPIVTGTLNLNHASITIPSINITLNNISATMTGKDNILNFDLAAFSQQQPIHIIGAIDLTKPGFPIQMHLTSNQARLVNTEEYSLYATADLDILMIGKNLKITGNLTIPKGLIAPNDFQNTQTLPKSDIVYVGSITPKRKSFWDISMAINGRLGNDVELNVAGITTKLAGTIQLAKQNDEEYFATGELALHNGTYHVYGQTLTIAQNSYITYTHNLLNNPGLSIQASKVIESIDNLNGGFTQKNLVVGIQMQGNVKDPRITFFSSRGNLSQADILSYILLGYGSNSTVPGNTDFLIRALSAVNITSQGLLGKQNIASQIQQGLGLREMGVESETTVNGIGDPLNRQSAFVFGKSFTRHFYARYSVGLLDPVNVFQLRYLINSHWAVQSDSSSLGNGGDVLYTVDYD